MASIKPRFNIASRLDGWMGLPYDRVFCNRHSFVSTYPRKNTNVVGHLDPRIETLVKWKVHQSRHCHFPNPLSYAAGGIASHSSCLFFCFSHSLASFLRLFLDTTFPAASTVGMSLSSHSKYSSEVLNISRGSTLARSRSSFSRSASLASCSSLAFAFVVPADSRSACASMSNLSRGRTKVGWGGFAVLEIDA